MPGRLGDHQFSLPFLFGEHTFALRGSLSSRPKWQGDLPARRSGLALQSAGPFSSIAAIALLVGLAHGAASGQNLKSFADAMMVFGVGAAAGLASFFFAYLRRLFRLERPLQDTSPLRWLAIAAAIAGVVCFVIGLGVARNAVSSEKAAILPAAISPDTIPP